MFAATGIAIGVALVGFAAYLAALPWTQHGGRFVTEYLAMGGTIGFIGAALTLYSFIKL